LPERVALVLLLRKQKIYVPPTRVAIFLLKVAASVGLMATVVYTTMVKRAGAERALAAQAAGGARRQPARRRRLRRQPRGVRLPAARLLAAGGWLMGAPLEAFEIAVRQDDARIDLARACLLIAQDAYPGLDVERYLAEIDGLAIRLRSRLPNRGAPRKR